MAGAVNVHLHCWRSKAGLVLRIDVPWIFLSCSLVWLLFLVLATCETSEIVVLSELNHHRFHPSLLPVPMKHSLWFWSDHVDVRFDDDKSYLGSVAILCRKCHIEVRCACSISSNTHTSKDLCALTSLLLSNRQGMNCLWNDASQEYCKSFEVGEDEEEQNQICGKTNETSQSLSISCASFFVMG